MRRILLKAAAAAAFCVALLTASAPAASADVTIGQTGPPSMGVILGPGWVRVAQDAVVPDGGGIITSLNTQSGSFLSSTCRSGTSYDLLALRPLGASQYRVLGKTGPQADPCDGQLHSYPVSAQVQAGDMLGIYVISGEWWGVLNQSGQSAGGPAPDPAVGDTITTTWGFSYTLDLSATVAPTPDTTAPSTTLVLLPDPPAGGWYRTSPVGVSIHASDPDDQVAQTRCVLDPASAPQAFSDLPDQACTLMGVSGDGQHTIYAASVDSHGNAEAVKSATVKIDTTAPSTTIALDPASPTGAGGFYTSSVGVSIQASDPDDTVAQTRCALDPAITPYTFSGLPDQACTLQSITADGEHTLYAASVDSHGNVGALQKVTLKIDASAPTVKITAPVDGASYMQGTPLNADYSCQDQAGASGLASCTGTVDNGAPIDTSQPGYYTFAVTATDNVGNKTTQTVGYTVTTDITAPTVNINTPADGAVYAQGAEWFAEYSCQDEAGGSGIASCTGTVDNGAPIDTAQLGAYTFTVTATDNAGNKTTQTVSYTVIAGTETSVVCDPSTLYVGQSTTCTVTVTDTSAAPTTPTGTVGVVIRGALTQSGNCILTEKSPGTASCSVDFTPHGAGAAGTASYIGDSTHAGSQGFFSLHVDRRPTSTAVSCDPNPVLLPSYSDCTATVTDTSGMNVAPGGTVRFTSSMSGGTWATCTLHASSTEGGVSSCGANYLAPRAGTATITGQYIPSPAGPTQVYDTSSGQTSLVVTADTSPPEITPNIDGTLGKASWYTSNVTLSWSVVDDQSTITDKAGCGETTVTADTGVDGQTFTCTATSAGGTAHRSVTIKRDATAPSLNPALSTGTNPVYLKQTGVTVSPNAGDSASGLATASCGQVDTSTTGVHTLTCSASDNAGNTASQTVSYTVQYKILGFYSPPANTKVTAGQTVAIKIGLGDVSGTRISDTDAAAIARACRVTVSASGAQTLSAQCMKYDTSIHQFLYTWKTAKTPLGAETITVNVSYGTGGGTGVKSETVTINR